MTIGVGVINLIIGSVYTSYGVMTILDLRRHRDSGRSLFGYAWIAMAFTCGPHHLDHGAHAIIDGQAGTLDLLAIIVGLPAGVTWFLLRVEAMLGTGTGDRQIRGLPHWVEALPALSTLYLLAFVAYTMRTYDGGLVWNIQILPNIALVVLYTAIGYVLLRTQLANYATHDEWSLSGLSLTIVFPTCALMHGAWALYGAEGRYAFHGHIVAIDTLAVPAAAFFLWVVWSLYQGTLIDWNSNSDTSPTPVSGAAADQIAAAAR